MIENLFSYLIGVLAVVTIGYWFLVTIDTVKGMKTVKIIQPEKHEAPGQFPKVSIIVTAKDEELSIARSLETIKALDYPDYEVIVINDRSSDRTLEKVTSIQKEWPALKIISIEKLPAGWVGKTHACYRGYREASGAILLFTDADVLFKPESLRTAVAYMLKRKVDHFAVSPVIFGEPFLLRLFVQYFLFSFLIYFRPWAGGIGIGAFNMFCREAYERLGTHRAIALRPDEDVQLGKLAKNTGLRQSFASGKQLMSVRWYTSLREAMQGIEKNAFAGLQYRFTIAAAAIAGQILLFFYPFVGVVITSGWMQIGYGVVLLFMVTVYLRHNSVFSNSKGFEVVFLPLSALLFIYVVSRALVKTIIHRGVYWRGTFYSLRELRKGEGANQE